MSELDILVRDLVANIERAIAKRYNLGTSNGMALDIFDTSVERYQTIGEDYTRLKNIIAEIVSREVAPLEEKLTELENRLRALED